MSYFPIQNPILDLQKDLRVHANWTRQMWFLNISKWGSVRTYQDHFAGKETNYQCKNIYKHTTILFIRHPPLGKNLPWIKQKSSIKNPFVSTNQARSFFLPWSVAIETHGFITMVTINNILPYHQIWQGHKGIQAGKSQFKQ